MKCPECGGEMEGTDSSSICKQWEVAGIECVIMHHHSVAMRWFTAYIRLERTHPWLSKDYERLRVQPHGGWTFGGTPRNLKRKGWLGWDYAHAWDWVGAHSDDAHRWTKEEVAAEVETIARKARRAVTRRR